MFVVACVERPLLLLRDGRVAEDEVDYTLQSFVEAGRLAGFEAGDVPIEPYEPDAATSQESAEESGRQRLLVFARMPQKQRQ